MAYFVTVNEGNIVQAPYDDINNNVPVGALPITDAEFKQLSLPDNQFDDFRIVGNTLQLRAEAVNNRKDRIVDAFQVAPEMKAFIEYILDELNILRGEQALPPRTMVQLKNSMKTKL